MDSLTDPRRATASTMLPSSARAIIYAVGTALFLASLLFVGLSAARNWPAVYSLHAPRPSWLIVSAALYAVSHASTGLAWPLALRQLGEQISLADGLRIGLVAQAGKYLPGNVAHYFGRGVLARVAGVPLKTTGLSTAVELVSALCAAIIVSLILIAIDPRSLAFVPNLSANAVVLGSSIALAALAFGIWMRSRGHGARLFTWPIACLVVSLLLSGLSFVALLTGLGFDETPVTLVIAAVSLAWVGGFLVPGAPAGFGVREAILVAVLSPQVGIGAAIGSALLHRLMTAAADGAAALAGYLWMCRSDFSKK